MKNHAIVNNQLKFRVNYGREDFFTEPFHKKMGQNMSCSFTSTHQYTVCMMSEPYLPSKIVIGTSRVALPSSNLQHANTCHSLQKHSNCIFSSHFKMQPHKFPKSFQFSAVKETSKKSPPGLKTTYQKYECLFKT